MSAENHSPGKAQKLRRKRSARYKRRREILFPFDEYTYRLCFWATEKYSCGKELDNYIEGKKVLVFSPHQDDETLGCGGLILGCNGRTDFQPVLITNGKGPQWARTEEKREQQARIREEELLSVCEMLGTRSPVNFGFDGPDISGPSELLVSRMENIISASRPDIVMAPFPTDASEEHYWTTRALARVPEEMAGEIKLLFYRVHGQIPEKFQNTFYGLTEEMHTKKERALSLYKSQWLDRELIRSKHLLYSTLMPRKYKKKYKSIERYSMMGFRDFVVLDREIGNDARVPKIKSLNYAPYSFRCYLYNRMIIRTSPAIRKSAAYNRD